MRSRYVVAVLAGAGAVAGALVSVAPAQAAPAAKANAIAGYVSTLYSSPGAYDSADKPVTVNSLSTGEYDVVFGGLAAIAAKGGNIEVSPVADQATCAVRDWGKEGSDLVVYVNCYEFNGTPQSDNFDLTVTRATAVRSGVLDYALVGNYAKPHKLSGNYLFNSTRGRSTVDRLGTGRYLVDFAGRAKFTNTGTVKVSAEGAGAGDCQVVKWLGQSTGTQVWVDCFAANGTRQNRDFFVVYARSNNILGRYGMTTANAAADRPRTAVYTPSPQYDSAKGAKVTALTVNKGLYVPAFAGTEARSGPGGYGDIQLGAMGSSYVHCYAEDLLPAYLMLADVSCVNNASKQVYASYVVQLLVG